MQLGKQDIGEFSIRYLVAYDQDTSDGAGTVFRWVAQCMLGRYGEQTFYAIVKKGRNKNFERYEWEWLSNGQKLIEGSWMCNIAGVTAIVGWKCFVRSP